MNSCIQPGALEVWAQRTTEAWVRRTVEAKISAYCDGAWRGLEHGHFVWSANPQKLADEIVHLVMVDILALEP